MFNDKHREDLKEAHAAEVLALKHLADILAEQVEYLRAQLAARPNSGFPTSTVAPLNPSNQPTIQEGFPLYVSEIEQELREMNADGHMDDDELEAALQALDLGPITD